MFVFQLEPFGISSNFHKGCYYYHSLHSTLMAHIKNIKNIHCILNTQIIMFHLNPEIYKSYLGLCSCLQLAHIIEVDM